MKTDIPFIVTKRELEWLYKHQTKQILRQKKIITREKEYLVMIKWSIPQETIMNIYAPDNRAFKNRYLSIKLQ